MISALGLMPASKWGIKNIREVEKTGAFCIGERQGDRRRGARNFLSHPDNANQADIFRSGKPVTDRPKPLLVGYQWEMHVDMHRRPGKVKFTSLGQLPIVLDGL